MSSIDSPTEESHLSDLHDAALQLAIAIEMQIDILRRRALAEESPLASELTRLKGFIHEELLKHRKLMQQMSSVNRLDSSTFIQFLKDTAERFQRETGISARFVSELDEVKMSPQVCGAMARILQECLVNVRRMRGSQHAEVRLSATDSHWLLSIEDDGREPVRLLHVIREQVNSIGGELAIGVASSGQGSRLVVSVPR